LKADGLSEEEAFETAARRIGEQGPLAREFAKVRPAGSGSLRVVAFWMVAGIYLFQVVSSLVFGLLNLRQLMEQRELRRLVAGGADIHYVMSHVSWFYHLPPSFAPEMSFLVVLLLVFGVRLIAGRWKAFGVFFRSFERPTRTVLGLVALGLILAVLPNFLAFFLTPEKILVVRNLDEMYGLFALGYFQAKFAVPLAGYVAGQTAINGVLVFTMVLLARRGLRRNEGAQA
jgi:hypothetical protein